MPRVYSPPPPKSTYRPPDGVLLTAYASRISARSGHGVVRLDGFLRRLDPAGRAELLRRVGFIHVAEGQVA